MPKFYSKRALKEVRERYGKEESIQNFEFPEIEKQFLRMMKKDDWILDDQTWNDLDMNRNFVKMNRTFTNPGQQMLYHQLRILQFEEEELKRRNGIIEFLRHNSDEREKLQCLLRYVGKDHSDSAGNLLFTEVPPLPGIRAWVIPSLLGLLASIVLIPFWGARAVLLLVLFFIINMIIHASFLKYTQSAMPGLGYVARMLRIAKEIAAMQEVGPLEEYQTFFDKAVDKCRVILRKNGAFGAPAGDFMGILSYLKIATLSEERAYLRSLTDIKENAPVLRTLYRRIGELDAYQSVASFRRELHHMTTPVFTKEPLVLKATELGHPMLVSPVCNDVAMIRENMVLTGSNMSGKSTFLRTIGFNMLLAQTFYMVMAKSYEASMFSLLTSISPSDDMQEGRSYYMAEASALKRMLSAVEGERPTLLLIDEIFRGTNPAERVAAASSLLKYLSQKSCLMVVATHDIEITSQVQDCFSNYYFQENVSKDSLSFDYKLREGVLQEPNGIRILEYLGYPEEITEEAYRLAEKAGVKAKDAP